MTVTIPSTTQGWRLEGTGPDDGSTALFWEEGRELPTLTDVLVRFHTWSINYPELAIANGTYPWKPKVPASIPGSDASGEIIALGSDASVFKLGDQVFPVYYRHFYHGTAPSAETGHDVPGLDAPGVFSEFAVMDQRALIRAPTNYSHEETASLACSALTAWNSLYGYSPIKPGSWVLVQGTGGVSMFAIKFAIAAGATVIVTTGSESKVPLLKGMAIHHIINYKQDPNWGETARKLTPRGLGCDHVIEVGGPSTIKQSFQCVARGGVVSVIGFLDGVENLPGGPSFIEPLLRACVVRGIEVGSRQQLEDMIRAIEDRDIRPVLDDKKFTLKQLKEVYNRVWNKEHFGKVTISGI